MATPWKIDEQYVIVGLFVFQFTMFVILKNLLSSKLINLPKLQTV